MSIEIGTEPDCFIGKQIEHGSAVFELGSILRAGTDEIVYDARDLRTGQSEHVLKVYRRGLSEEDFEQTQATYRECAEMLGDACPERHFFRIGDWAVMLQRKAFHFVSSNAAASQAQNFEGRLSEVVDLLNAGDFASTVQKCDEALGEFPTSPEYLRSKGIALLGMGDSRAANEALGLCFEINPDDAEHYVVVIQACASLGQILWARKWAHEGAKRARDRREIYRAWFEVEEQAEHAKLMRMCLGQLRLLEEPQQSLEELRMRLQGLEERLARCERELEDAWRSLQQRRLEDAERISRRLTQEHPHHMPALFLSGVLAIERERWADAIGHLRRAFLHRPLAEPDVPFLLGHAYLKLGKVYHATVMHLVWQEHYNEAAAALDRRGLHERERAGALAVLTFESEYERRLAQDAAALAQQGQGILGTYRAVSDAVPETRERIAEIVQGTNRLLGWLAGGSCDGR